MPSELATAYVRIVPTTEGITENLESALSGASNTAGEKSGKNIAGGIAKGLGIGAAAIGTAAVGMVTGLVNGAKSVAEYGDNVDKMSQKIGISAQSYQQWDYVMQRAGTSIDSMKTGMKTLSTQAQNNAQAFQALGLSEEQVASMSQEELFTATVRGLAGMEAGTERTALATQLLGKAGADMAPLLNKGTEAIDEQMQMALDYGMVMSDDMVSASATFQDSMTTLTGAFTGLKNRLLGEFLPSMTQVTDGIGQLFTGDIEGGLASISEGIDGFIGKLTDMVPKVLEVGGQVVMKLADAILQNAPKLISSATGLIMEFASSLVSSLPQVVGVAAQVVVSLASGIGSALPTLIPAVVSAIGQVCSTIISNLPMILQAVLLLVQGAAQGIVSAIPILLEFIPVLIDQILSELPGMISMINSSLSTLIPLLIQGCMSLVSGIVSAIPVILQSLISYLPEILNQVISGLLSNLVILVQGCITLVEGIVSAAPEIVSSLIEYLPELVIQVASVLVKNLPVLVMAVGQMIVGIVSALPGLFQKIITSTVQLTGQLASKIGSLIAPFISAAGQWVSGLVSGITQKWQTLVSNIQQKVQNIISSIGSWFSSGTGGIGMNLVRGLWSGISSGWSWLTGQVQSLAKRLLSSVKSALGIHSPSTEMMWVGEMFNAGLAEGLSETAGVESALSNVNGMLVDAVNPDLALNAQIGANSPAGGQMGALVELVAELRKDVTNLKIYLDSGALVGGIIGQTDQQLGRRDVLAQRGGAV